MSVTLHPNFALAGAALPAGTYTGIINSIATEERESKDGKYLSTKAVVQLDGGTKKVNIFLNNNVFKQDSNLYNLLEQVCTATNTDKNSIIALINTPQQFFEFFIGKKIDFMSEGTAAYKILDHATAGLVDIDAF